MRARALLACTQQVIGQQPFTQGDVGVLEDRSYGDTELLTTPATLPHAFADVLVLPALLGRLWLQFVGIVNEAAVRTDRATGPSQLFDEFPRLIFVAKVLSQCD